MTYIWVALILSVICLIGAYYAKTQAKSKGLAVVLIIPIVALWVPVYIGLLFWIMVYIASFF